MSKEDQLFEMDEDPTAVQHSQPKTINSKSPANNNANNNNNEKPKAAIPAHLASPKTSTSSILHGSTANLNWVTMSFSKFQQEDPDTAIPVAAVKTLVQVLKQSSANTLMGLEIEVKNSINLLIGAAESQQMSTWSACELFGRFVTKKTKILENFEECKRQLIERGERFAAAASRGREKIASFADNFIRDGSKILTHGYSKAIYSVLKCAAEKKNFSVIVTESRPDESGTALALALKKLGIPSTVISDSAVAHIIDLVDMVMVGAESICENGGIINKIGTYQIAIVAQAFRKPIYVCAESFKFMRFYPLNQRDMDWKSIMSSNFQSSLNTPANLMTSASPLSSSPSPFLSSSSSPNFFSENLTKQPFPFKPSSLGRKEEISDSPSQRDHTTQPVRQMRDYTPPSLITLLFTDIGILTPSAVSDELIKFY